MKIACAQLKNHVTRSLKGLYLISGDEPLQAQEATDMLRQTAKQAGYIEHIRIATDITDWLDTLYIHIQSGSLLSSKRFIELDLRTTRLTPSHTKKLATLFPTLPNDIVLLILAKRPDAKGLPAWQQILEKTGVVISVWPIKGDQLPQWILQRAKDKQLPLSNQAARLLAEKTEGHLLAAAQELEKLILWQGNTPLSTTQLDTALQEMISNSARYDIFQLAQAIKSKNRLHAFNVLARLLLAGTEPVLILWAITRELRTLSPTPIKCLHDAARIDRIIKGVEQGHVQHEIEKLLLAITDRH